MDFIRFNGETVVYLGIITLGGGILLAIFTGLFAALKITWIPKQIGIYGATAAPLAAVFVVDRIVGSRLKIALCLQKYLLRCFFCLLLLISAHS